MQKIVLHVGTHKTGTTAVQVFARQQPETLRQHGIYYPTSGRPLSAFKDGHHLLPWSVAGRPIDGSYWPDGDCSSGRVWSALLDEARSRPEPTILVSSEEFSVLSARQVQAIADILVGFEVVPIIYFRRFDEYLQAMYATNVIHGERRCISDYFKSNKNWMDYTRILSAWRCAFGRSLIVRPFFRDTLTSRSIICDIFEVFGRSIDASSVTGYSRTNAGIPWNIVECARVLNKLGASTPTIMRLWKFSNWLYYYEHVSYDLLAPTARKQLVGHTLAFFEQEFKDWKSEALWTHLRGSELAESNVDWDSIHSSKYAFMSRTLSHVLAHLRASLTRRWVQSFVSG